MAPGFDGIPLREKARENLKRIKAGEDVPHGPPPMKGGAPAALKDRPENRRKRQIEAQEREAESPEAAELGHDGKKWIAGAIKHPGALHRDLGVPQGQKIPESKLSAAASKGGKVGQRARLAETLGGLGHDGAPAGGKVEKTMHEFKEGELHSGSKAGPMVTNRKQAVAIALSQARRAGEKVSPKK
jgi:hypothetical protein